MSLAQAPAPAQARTGDEVEVSTRPAPAGRLCIVTHRCQKNDGQGRVTYEIAKAALQAGWHVSFVGSDLAPDLAQDARLAWTRIPPARLPSNLLRYQVFARRSARWLDRHAAGFDIIHAQGFITWHAADVNTAHFVHAGWLHSGYYPFRWLQSPYAAYQRLYTTLNAGWERRAFRQARRVVAVSGKLAAELAAIGVADRQVAVIYNGVDLDEFRAGPGNRAAFSLPPAARPASVPLFLFAGDIRTPRKNLETVLRALVHVPGAHLAIAGTAAGSPYPDMARTLGVADRAHFLGMVRDMSGLMRCVDAFVFPSRYDPLGLVLLEAMASGLPVITAGSAGAAEIVGDGGRIMADPDDAATLAAWMAELAADPAQRQAMGARARAIAQTHSWAGMTARYLDLYDRVRDEKRR